MKTITGGITAPKGFKAAGAHVGIKKAKKDLALVTSGVPAVVSGVFTTNKVKAAPVIWDMKAAERGTARGIVINSGNANACTGEQGVRDCFATALALAEELKVTSEDILVCSTGVIGVPLPIDTIKAGVASTAKLLNDSAESADSAAEAISTTDTFFKETAVEFEVGGVKAKMGGMAKGSGMIHPNMATTLAFVTTDAAISKRLADLALKDAADKTFNMISVDGDTSTNDTILLLANGAAENAEITEKNPEGFAAFKEALTLVLQKLAKDVARDGEGATKLLEATVSGAVSEKDARLAARGIVSSNLFKAAMFGADANWGRAICAAGYSGAEFDPCAVDLKFRSAKGEIVTMKDGSPVVFDEDKAKNVLSERDIFVDVDFKNGSYSATAWGCDLTYDYVKINGDYRS